MVTAATKYPGWTVAEVSSESEAGPGVGGLKDEHWDSSRGQFSEFPRVHA